MDEFDSDGEDGETRGSDGRGGVFVERCEWVCDGRGFEGRWGVYLYLAGGWGWQ